MRRDRFDLNLLIALDVLLDERSVTRASQRLNIGQSATSSALARLRDHFGDELLRWDGKRSTLTPLAQQLQDPVRDALLRARAAVSLKEGFSPANAQRSFSICASDYAVTVLLGRALAHIHELAPGIAVEIRMPQRRAVDTFERGGIDLMIMPEPYLERVQHPRAPLFSDTQVCMVCASNPLVGGSLGFDQYLAMGHVITRFATLHRRLGEHFAKQLPVRLLAAPFDMPPVVEAMVWPRYLEYDPAHVWLRQTLLTCAAQLPALETSPMFEPTERTDGLQMNRSAGE